MFFFLLAKYNTLPPLSHSKSILVSNYVCCSHISNGMISFFISTVDLYVTVGDGGDGKFVQQRTIYNRVNIFFFFFFFIFSVCFDVYVYKYFSPSKCIYFHMHYYRPFSFTLVFIFFTSIQYKHSSQINACVCIFYGCTLNTSSLTPSISVSVFSNL